MIYGETQLPPVAQNDKRFFLWKDFLKVGEQIKDELVDMRARKQKPGHCCCLIYTSGTTGNPKGCMLTHDNLTWLAAAIMDAVTKDLPELVGPHNRVVSYLPLSHIAGLAFDVLNHYYNGSELYFARPDALQGTLLQTLTWARPTIFFAVPRVWEKFEEKLKEIAASKPDFVKSISGWAKSYGMANVQATIKRENPPFMFHVANFLILKRIKQALGLD